MTQTKEKPSKTGRRNPVDASGYHNDDARDEKQKVREQSRRFVSFLEARERIDAGRLEVYMGALARASAARASATHASAERSRWRKVIERIDSIAGELEVDREQVYYMALAGFIEKYEEALKEHADESPTASPDGGLAECTEEEFNAILKADRLEPELVEGYKDLVED